jgi:hypothetical protein
MSADRSLSGVKQRQGSIDGNDAIDPNSHSAGRYSITSSAQCTRPPTGTTRQSERKPRDRWGCRERAASEWAAGAMGIWRRLQRAGASNALDGERWGGWRAGVIRFRGTGPDRRRRSAGKNWRGWPIAASAIVAGREPVCSGSSGLARGTHAAELDRENNLLQLYVNMHLAMMARE